MRERGGERERERYIYIYMHIGIIGPFPSHGALNLDLARPHAHVSSSFRCTVPHSDVHLNKLAPVIPILKLGTQLPPRLQTRDTMAPYGAWMLTFCSPPFLEVSSVRSPCYPLLIRICGDTIRSNILGVITIQQSSMGNIWEIP